MQKGILILLLLCVFSCTIEKRVYLPGYSIHWKHRKETVKNDVVTLRLKEENNPIMVREKAETKQLQPADSQPVSDTAVSTEIQPDEIIVVPAKQQDIPLQLKQKIIHPKTALNTIVYNDPEEEREPNYPNGFMQFLAVFLGIICGIIASVFAVLLIFLASDFSAFDSNGSKSDDQKTFKSVFLAAFRVTFMFFSVLLIVAALILLAIYFYLAFGIWALIFTIIGIILVLLLLTFLLNKAFEFVFRD
ncbi:MAG: hypothetical protein V4604_11020 [Bacteroidota bacterium]